MDIKKILAEHVERKLPSFPVDDEFSEWVEELIETDAYYFGLASSYINGEIKPYKCEYFSDLKSKFERIQPIKSDIEIYESSSAYLESLSKIIAFLNESYNRKIKPVSDN